MRNRNPFITRCEQITSQSAPLLQKRNKYEDSGVPAVLACSVRMEPADESNVGIRVTQTRVLCPVRNFGFSGFRILGRKDFKFTNL